MALSDTSDKSREVYYARLRETTPSERVRLGVALWEAGDALQRSAMRRKYPEADEDEIVFQIAITRFGLGLARKVYKRS